MTGKFRKDGLAAGRRPAFQAALALLIMLLTLAAPVQAAPLARPSASATVGGSCAESDLDTALAAGGVITFNCGGPKTIPITSVKTITQDTTLSGGDAITLTGGFTTRLFIVNSGVTFQLQHIVLDQAASTGSDGGAIVNHGALSLDHATIQHSQTDSAHSGGAIFSDGPLTLTSSTLISNTAGSGGALFANFGNARVTVDNSTFRDNKAINLLTGYGGAIWVGQHAQLALTGGALISNTAGSGGALYIISGTVTLAGTALNGNLANHDGGGLLNLGSILTATNIALNDNTALQDGGGIKNDGGLVTLTNATLHHNHGVEGGGLDNEDGGQTSLTDSVLSNNIAGDLGGGINNSGSGLALKNVLFSANSADIGGGLSTQYSDLTATDLTLSGNMATGSGGGLYEAYSGVNITNITFHDNHTPGTGGAILLAYASLALNGARLSDNTAHAGGALYIDHGSVSLKDASLSGNSAATTGGAMHLGAGEVTLTNATLSGNSAANGGGIYNASGTATLRNTTLSGNWATGVGGGLSDDGGSFWLTNATLSGNFAPDGGGLYQHSQFVTQTITLSNTVIASGPSGENCVKVAIVAGSITSTGYNLSDDSTCTPHFTQTGDLNNQDPHLGPLGNNGGPTQTHLPGLGSPAINAIPAGVNGCGTTFITDQRGAPRPIHGQCDMGAVEAGWVHPALWLPILWR